HWPSGGKVGPTYPPQRKQNTRGHHANRDPPRPIRHALRSRPLEIIEANRENFHPVSSPLRRDLGLLCDSPAQPALPRRTGHHNPLHVGFKLVESLAGQRHVIFHGPYPRQTNASPDKKRDPPKAGRVGFAIAAPTGSSTLPLILDHRQPHVKQRRGPGARSN